MMFFSNALLSFEGKLDCILNRPTRLKLFYKPVSQQFLHFTILLLLKIADLLENILLQVLNNQERTFPDFLGFLVQSILFDKTGGLLAVAIINVCFRLCDSLHITSLIFDTAGFDHLRLPLV